MLALARRPSRLAVFATLFIASMTAAADDKRVVKTPVAPLDPARIYRFDPLLEKFTPIDRKSLKPLHIYHRFSPALRRWVWSKTSADGRLEFAMGPGSVQQAFLFDLTATMEERKRALEQRAPEIARLYAVQGARAAMILNADGTWGLHGVASVGHIFDLETSERWEWHGDHRTAVVHGRGNSWQWLDRGYVPAR
jgi:hypothetical protein